MERSCERAIEVGLPAIAFTEHADWAIVHKGQHSVDLPG
jgi:histidinol phosphatase-like PHP family hydrolase